MLVALASLVLAVAGWSILGLPARAISEVIPDGNCTTLTPGTSAMTWCSARVGLMRVLGPMLVVLAMLFLRKPLSKVTRLTSAKLPRNLRFLVAPTMATGLFTMAYAEIHRSTADQSGLVPQRIFPVVIGLFMFALSRGGPALSRKLGGFFRVRDKVPVWVRIPIALLPPLLIGYTMMKGDVVTDTARKEQLTILLSLATMFLAVAPRSGELGRLRLPGGATSAVTATITSTVRKQGPT